MLYRAVEPVSVQPRMENRWEPLYGRFRKQHPPTFEGGPNPLLAEQWVNMTSSTMDFMEVGGNERVACANYILREDALIWWEIVFQRRDVTTMTWGEFRDVFIEKYYSVAVQSVKVDEFTNLTQNKMTVTEYALRFDRLAKFAPDLVPTDMARRY
ncbi:uncharacterized protein LOC133830457 [Humulus lupulus]|uniref:uncharacterized protein LOC133830457 n=1 Tax=Humulus lupulus TaxID=3486 RepID=UPI002B401872|nr:uncharacterized protein LOC133830457 [Humulus lupulus]